MGFRAVAFYAGNGTNQGSMDEMRIASTYASATPQGPTYQWQLNGSNITGALSTTYNSGPLAAADALRLIVTSTGSCLNSTTATSNTITVSNSNQWVGSTSTSWNTGANWCGGVPTSTLDVVIPSGTTFSPQITGVAANAKGITINSGATLTLLSGQSLNIYGNFTNNGTFTDNGGTVSYLGSSAQTALNMAVVKNLTLANTAGLTLSSNTRVNGILTLTNGALTSNGRLTVSMTTGAIAPTGSGSVVGTMTVRRESSDFSTADLVANFHYVGSPLAGVPFSDIADNVAFTSTNFYGYNEGSGNTYIQARWKSLVTGAFAKLTSTLMNAQLFTNGPNAMVGYALKFNNLPTTTEILDFTGTYTHGTGTSFTTGNMSYTNGGQAWGNGWQLLANPYPSYIDWRLVTTSNVEAGITYYNSTTNNNADYIPASGSFGDASNNGGSPYIPAMQAYWVQVSPAGNGIVTVPNSARLISPVFTGYGVVPNFYREARPTAHSLKLIAANDKGADETSIRFGEGATRQFDGKWDLFRTSPNGYIPTLSTETEKLEYGVNSLPAIDAETSVDVNVEIPSSGAYTLALKETINMENYEAVNLSDRQTNVTQNLLINDTYSFNATKGDKKQRFVINLKPATITNLNAASSNAMVTISSNNIDEVNIQTKNTSTNLANVSIINVLGQEVFTQTNLNLSSGIGTLRMNSNTRSIYIVKAIIDGRTYSKEIFLGK